MYKVLLMLCAVCIFIYTMSYGLWEWRHNNKFGSAFVYALAVLEIGLSIYTVVVY